MMDPIEQIEQAIEGQVDLVDEDGLYPCCYCETRVPVEMLLPISEHPASPGMCQNCCDAENQRLAALR